MTLSLVTLNSAPRPDALAALEPLVERAPWICERAVDARPFASADALAEALVEAILAATAAERLALFNGHPDLSGREAREGRMTVNSTAEQARLGLTALTAEDAARLDALNARYRARFGHPFILALHRVPDRAALFATFEQRLARAPLEEHASTLAEIASVIRGRCVRAFGADAPPLPTPPLPTSPDQTAIQQQD